MWKACSVSDPSRTHRAKGLTLVLLASAVLTGACTTGGSSAEGTSEPSVPEASITRGAQISARSDFIEGLRASGWVEYRNALEGWTIHHPENWVEDPSGASLALFTPGFDPETRLPTDAYPLLRIMRVPLLDNSESACAETLRFLGENIFGGAGSGSDFGFRTTDPVWLDRDFDGELDPDDWTQYTLEVTVPTSDGTGMENQKLEIWFYLCAPESGLSGAWLARMFTLEDGRVDEEIFRAVQFVSISLDPTGESSE